MGHSIGCIELHGGYTDMMTRLGMLTITTGTRWNALEFQLVSFRFDYILRKVDSEQERGY